MGLPRLILSQLRIPFRHTGRQRASVTEVGRAFIEARPIGALPVGIGSVVAILRRLECLQERCRMTVLQDLRVLVVENDEMSAALLQMRLVHAGATVVRLAASGIAHAGRLGPGCGPAGLSPGARNETSEPVAAALSARGVPFVLATGMLAEQLPESMLAGVLLVKPYLSADLTRALARAVGRSSATA